MMTSSKCLQLAAILLLASCACLADRSYSSSSSSSGSSQRGNNMEVSKCVSGSDCAPNECSVMGMQRYSEPECRPRGGLNDSCRMYADEPEDKTLHFPHTTMECTDVYMQFCPCSAGLVCREAKCQPATVSLSSQNSNELDEAGEAEADADANDEDAEWAAAMAGPPAPVVALAADSGRQRAEWKHTGWALGRFH